MFLLWLTHFPACMGVRQIAQSARLVSPAMNALGQKVRFWRKAAIRNFGERRLELTQRMNNEFASMIAAVSLTAARCVEIARSVQDRRFKRLGVSFLRILSVKSDEPRRVHPICNATAFGAGALCNSSDIRLRSASSGSNLTLGALA
jgi:hypothetical protein